MTTPSSPEMPDWERDLIGEPIDLDPPGTRDKLMSLGRTLVPILWGMILTFAAARIPAVHGFLGANEPVLYPVLDAVVTGVWYAACRWLEDHLPAWLTRLVLGANTQPVYDDRRVR